MGGLKKHLPVTYATMGIGALSLAGFPLFAGFWSKDEVLTVSTNAGPLLFLFALITVFLTAFYTFRMFFLTFHGRFRGPVHAVEASHPPVADAETHQPGLHEADWFMKLPLILLAIPALLIGFLGSPFSNYAFQRFLEGPAFHEVPLTLLTPIISVGLALAGIVIAWLMYGARQFATEPLLKFGGLYTLLERRYYIDELYMTLIDKLAIGIAATLAIFDRQALDGIVNGIAGLFGRGGATLRGVQTGRVQNYGLVLFGGMAVIALALLASPVLSALVKR
jgi:NADH:ubiquinone oxidoreductase subunit 5 (subunit L)/multisubunit Na+/H+ antiporter MnhA subunit